MNFSRKTCLFLCLSSIYFGFTQERKQDSVTSKIPNSLYTSVKISPDLNSAFHINQRLQLNSYKFMVLDEKSIEAGYFTIPMYNIYQSPTEYIYDSYNKINHTLNLQKAFYKVSDLYKVRARNSY